MPCYLKNRIEVELHAADLDMLKAAAMEMGLEVDRQGERTRITRNGREVFTVTGTKAKVQRSQLSMVNALKRSYSEKALGKGAQKFGWSRTTDKGKTALRKGGGW